MQSNFERFGNYILLEKLAAGGMAEVYLAKKLGADGVQKFVAIKRILSQFSDSGDFIQMFKDEAKLAVNLSHQNVVSIYDFGVESGQFYLVMEYVEGKNLRQVLNFLKKINKQFTIGQIVYIIQQVALGLDHAHRCIDNTTGQPLNIIHRDMSPQNVMLNFDGNCKIVDFGIAKAATQLENTRAGTLKGKFGYMSPEQSEGMAIDIRTDIFALGIMIWELLSGQRLFLANNEMNTLRKIRECNVPSLRKINPNIPPELEKIVNKSLAKDRNTRYQTAADFSRDLTGFLNRFDPDFSAQNLSDFLKSIFSDEILELRNKQISFAKVEVAPTTYARDDKTEVVTLTSSLTSDQSALPSGLELNTSSSMSDSNDTNSNVDFKSSGLGLKKSKNEDSKIIKLNVSPGHSKDSKVKSNTSSSITNMNQVSIAEKEKFLPKFIFSLSFIFLTLALIHKMNPEVFDIQCVGISNLTGLNLSCGSSDDGDFNLASATAKETSILSNPPGAKVYINGYPQKTTSVILPNPPFTISWQLPRHQTVTQHFNEIPKQKNLVVNMTRIPSGFIEVTAIGEIYINDLRVSSGSKISVPADEPVKIKAINPITRKVVEKTISVGEEKLKRIVLTDTN